MRWLEISDFPGDTPFERFMGSDTKHYDDILVWGPTWEGGWDESPFDGGEKWTGTTVARVASTWSGQGFFTSKGNVGPYEYDEYIKPTHWMAVETPAQSKEPTDT